MGALHTTRMRKGTGLPVLFFAWGILLATAVPGSAQGLRSGDAPDFLFERPRVTVALRGGLFLPRAQGDLYDFTVERFTLERSDWRGAALGLDVGVWVGPQLEILLSLDGSRVTRGSEYRDWVEPVEGPGGTVTEVPIRQDSRLSVGPGAALGVRWYLRDRGDALSRFVWIPAAANVFVGGGIGFTAYRLVLWGDFVDEVAETIHPATYESEGNTAVPHVVAGVEVRTSRRTGIVLESRYQWGSHPLGSDFASDFEDDLDLSGARLTAGLQFRF